MSAVLESTTAELCLEYQGRSIQIQSNAATTEWLQEFFCPAFQVVRSSPHDWRVNLAPAASEAGNTSMADANSQAEWPGGHERALDCFTLDGRFLTHRLVGGESSRRVYDVERSVGYEIDCGNRRVRVLPNHDCKNPRLAMMRAVRELATIQAVNLGMLPIHGAAFTIDDRAYILTGPKRSGKTTTLLRSLQNSQARFISNDRLFVTPTNPPRLHGMPTIINIRPDTWKFVPEFFQRFQSQAWRIGETRGEGIRRHQSTLEGQRSENANQLGLLQFNTSMTTAQFCDVTATAATSDVEVGAIIFPRISSSTLTISTERISPEVAARQLYSEGLLLPGPTLKTAEVFRTSFDRIEIPPDALFEQCQQLAHRVPSYQCELGPLANRDGFFWERRRDSFAA